jgi:FtsZ-binding cell division protein ZapB
LVRKIILEVGGVSMTAGGTGAATQDQPTPNPLDDDLKRVQIDYYRTQIASLTATRWDRVEFVKVTGAVLAIISALVLGGFELLKGSMKIEIVNLKQTEAALKAEQAVLLESRNELQRQGEDLKVQVDAATQELVGLKDQLEGVTAEVEVHRERANAFVAINDSLGDIPDEILAGLGKNPSDEWIKETRSDAFLLKMFVAAACNRFQEARQHLAAAPSDKGTPTFQRWARCSTNAKPNTTKPWRQAPCRQVASRYRVTSVPEYLVGPDPRRP